MLEKELNELINSGNFYPYHKNIEDKEFTDIKWNTYGDIKNNMLYVFAIYKNKKYIRKIKSPVLFPCMEDRIFGIDMYDEKRSRELSAEIFEKDIKPLLNNVS
jgi:hypothetical protein